MESKGIYILNEEEISFIYDLPNFSVDEREVFFALNETELNTFGKIKDLPTQILFILCLGHFKAKQRFFRFKYEDVKGDIEFILDKYFPYIQASKHFLSNANISANKRKILQLYNYTTFREKKKSVTNYVVRLARNVICPTTILTELIGYLNTHQIIIPSYTEIQNLIRLAINLEEQRIHNILAQNLNKTLDELLNKMLNQGESRLNLVSFKRIPKNFKYNELREECAKGSLFKEVYCFAKEIIKRADISEYNVKYYGMVAEKYNISSLKNLKELTAKFYLLCYIYHRYQQINDNIIICYNYYAEKFNNDVKGEVLKDFIEHTRNHQYNIPKVSRLLRFMSVDQSKNMNYESFYKNAYDILPQQEYNPTADYLDGISFNEDEVK